MTSHLPTPNAANKPFELIDTINNIKERINTLVDDSAVIVYSQNDLEDMAEADPRLQKPDQGFVSIMYAGMRPQGDNVQGKLGTTARFVIIASFKNDKLRVKGIEKPITMLRFMTELRRLLAGQKAPNNKTYTFASEAAFEIPGKGDGYMQEWNLSLTAFS